MNEKNYKNAVNQIHASEELKQKTFEKIKQKKSRKIPYMKYLAACAMLIVIFSGGIIYFTRTEKIPNNLVTIASSNNDLPRFESMEQLKSAIAKNRSSNIKGGIVLEDAVTTQSESSQNSYQTNSSESDYSKTNTQVNNVDEADIVKTDGEYIYYIADNTVYIVKAKELTIMTKIEDITQKEEFRAEEIYINDNKLIVLGTEYKYENNINYDVYYSYTRVNSKSMAKAIIYDISNKENPKIIRQVALDGRYVNSRMIEDNIYFISNKYMYYYDQMKDNDFLPIVTDTASKETTKIINYIDIAYFRDSKESSYMIVAGFNINNNEDVNTETFFGASNEVYASEKNLYITQTSYSYYNYYSSSKTNIYKFNLDESKIKLQCKGTIRGYVNDQFSMDEYEGNLRIATTYGYDENSKNQLYVLDKDLNEIGKIENLAKGEKIYSVRFIGKIGYIVTFEQIDPLFVIDLSDPTSPVVKGQLKIPGYSSYLHPYDETHIIGIGYNTKSNGYGGVVNTNMKMSMFDVSDLSNPKEVFNVDIGNEYANSEITYNHKALFYNKDKNLIGFPVSYIENGYRDNKDGFVIFKINLDKKVFEKYGEIMQENDEYRLNTDRVIYIGDILYTLSSEKITSYTLDGIKKIGELILK